MHFSALFLLCAFLAVCSELAAYSSNGHAVRGRPLRKSISLNIGLPGILQPPRPEPTYGHTHTVYYRRSAAAEADQPAEVHLPGPHVHTPGPQEEHEHSGKEPEAFEHEAPAEHEHEGVPHESEKFPSEPEAALESLAPPLEQEELPLLEEPAVVHEPERKSDLSVLYDYLYPMVLRKCLASAISSAMGLNSEDYNANYKHELKYIDHPLVQISGLDTLEELRRNLTAVAAARRRSSRLPKMTSGCLMHFNEIDADMQAAKEDILMSYAEALSEENFHLDNKQLLKYERLFKKDFMMHHIIRKLYELLRNHTSIYDVILALDTDLDKYIKHWNTKQ